MSCSISGQSRCTRSGSLVFSSDCAVRSKRNASWDNFSGGTSSGSERACLGRRLKQMTANVFLCTHVRPAISYCPKSSVCQDFIEKLMFS